MSDISFIYLDTILDFLPKSINKLIYEFYTKKCNECCVDQKFCIHCELFQCYCFKPVNIFCNRNDCDQILCCTPSFKICSCSDRILCPRCWRVDIYRNILPYV